MKFVEFLGQLIGTNCLEHLISDHKPDIHTHSLQCTARGKVLATSLESSDETFITDSFNSLLRSFHVIGFLFLFFSWVCVRVGVEDGEFVEKDVC